jgi:uncharacterized membrane protein YozB (DUF420 family)
MDPKFTFWSAALANLLVICTLVVVGILNVRCRRIDRHRCCMKTAAWLAAAFVVAYPFKLAVLGREQLSVWSPQAILTLRVHELFVMTMLVGGAIALLRARQMRATRNVSQKSDDPMAPGSTARGHRSAGWAAAVGATLGFATAIIVLVGMYGRLPGN